MRTPAACPGPGGTAAAAPAAAQVVMPVVRPTDRPVAAAGHTAVRDGVCQDRAGLHPTRAPSTRIRLRRRRPPRCGRRSNTGRDRDHPVHRRELPAGQRGLPRAGLRGWSPSSPTSRFRPGRSLPARTSGLRSAVRLVELQRGGGQLGELVGQFAVGQRRFEGADRVEHPERTVHGGPHPLDVPLRVRLREQRAPPADQRALPLVQQVAVLRRAGGAPRG